MERKGIIAAGNMLVDHVHQIRQWPERGWLVEIVHSERATGGAPLNVLLTLAKMHAGLPLYRATRAVHSCFVLHEGRILCACEDIGRHNALDKAVGSVPLAGVPLSECVLYTSGRVPMDMVRKAIRAGVPALVSKTMPTVQSLELAAEYGLQLLCGRKHPLTSSKSAG